jgi:hypothetical protein
MTPNTVLSTHSLIAIGYAIPLLCAPADFLWLYGVSVDVDATYLARLFGASLVAISATTWVAREAPEGAALDAICIGGSIGCGIGTLVSLHHQLVAPAIGPLGWTTVAVFAALSFSHGALWLQRAARRPPQTLQAG